MQTCAEVNGGSRAEREQWTATTTAELTEEEDTFHDIIRNLRLSHCANVVLCVCDTLG